MHKVHSPLFVTFSRNIEVTLRTTQIFDFPLCLLQTRHVMGPISRWSRWIEVLHLFDMSSMPLPGKRTWTKSRIRTRDLEKLLNNS